MKKNTCTVPLIEFYIVLYSAIAETREDLTALLYFVRKKQFGIITTKNPKIKP